MVKNCFMMDPKDIELPLFIVQTGHKGLQLCYHGNMLLCCCHGSRNNIFSFQVTANEKDITMGWAGQGQVVKGRK